MSTRKTKRSYIKVPYECIRCGYKTSQKGDMRKHFFELKKICPAVKNDIELSDDVKQYTLDNRIYKVPMKPELPKNLISDEGFVYLLYPREFKNSDEDIYKVGKTMFEKKRFSGYVKGYQMLLLLKVDDRHRCEDIVLALFKHNFEKASEYGYEYFKGDKDEMMLVMKEALKTHIVEIVEEYDALNSV